VAYSESVVRLMNSLRSYLVLGVGFAVLALIELAGGDWTIGIASAVLAVVMWLRVVGVFPLRRR